jgi:hypothetical protein
MKEFGSEIYAAVRSGRLMVTKACSGWAGRTYSTIPGKHAVGNGKTTELFVRVLRGWYRLNPSTVLRI